MLQTATVISISENGTAQVSVRRASACGHDCTSCGACGIMDKPLVVDAQNSIDAKIGDTVEIESESKKILYLASVVYLLPLLMFFVLYLLCFSFCKSDSVSLIIGGFGFILGILFAVVSNRREAKNKSVEYKIVRVL